MITAHDTLLESEEARIAKEFDPDGRKHN